MGLIFDPLPKAVETLSPGHGSASAVRHKAGHVPCHLEDRDARSSQASADPAKGTALRLCPQGPGPDGRQGLSDKVAGRAGVAPCPGRRTCPRRRAGVTGMRHHWGNSWNGDDWTVRFRSDHVAPLMKSGRAGPGRVTRIGASLLTASCPFRAGTPDLWLSPGQAEPRRNAPPDAALALGRPGRDPFALFASTRFP